MMLVNPKFSATYVNDAEKMPNSVQHVNDVGKPQIQCNM